MGLSICPWGVHQTYLQFEWVNDDQPWDCWAESLHRCDLRLAASQQKSESSRCNVAHHV